MTAALAQEQPVNLDPVGPGRRRRSAPPAFAEIIGDAEPRSRSTWAARASTPRWSSTAQPVLHQGAEFEGLPINTPSLYIHTIGAGGGSIAWLDEAGGLQVGPQSAGRRCPARPPTAAAATQPTFTDAALAVGYLGAETPLGETLTLDATLATAALEPIAERSASRCPSSPAASSASRRRRSPAPCASITVELGHDPKDFALLAFGGAGGLRRRGRRPRARHPDGDHSARAGRLLRVRDADGRRRSTTSAGRRCSRLADARRRHGRPSSAREMADEAAAGARRARASPPSGRCFTLRRRCPLLRPGAHGHRSGPDAESSDRGSRASASSSSSCTAQQYGHTMDDPIEITTLRLQRRRRRRQARSCRSSPPAPRGGGARADSVASTVVADGDTVAVRASTSASSCWPATSIDGPGGHRRAHRHHRDARAATVLRSATTASWSSHRSEQRSDGMTWRRRSPLEVIRHGLLVSARGDDPQPVPDGVQHGRLRDPRLRHRHPRPQRRHGRRCARDRRVHARQRLRHQAGRSSSSATTSMEPGDVFLLNYPYWSSRAHARPARVRPDPRRRRADRLHVLPHPRARPEGRRTPATSSTPRTCSRRASSSPPSRLYREGVINDDIFNIIRFNSRMPEPHHRRHPGPGLRRASPACGGPRSSPTSSASTPCARRCEAIHDHGERLARAALANCPRAPGPPSTTSTTTASTSTRW